MKLILITLVAVAALVLALWPVVADAPWENDSQLKADILDLQLDMSILEAGANRPASESEVCKSAMRILEHVAGLVPEGLTYDETNRHATTYFWLRPTRILIDNGCLAD